MEGVIKVDRTKDARGAYTNMQREYTRTGAIKRGQNSSDFCHIDRDFFFDVAHLFPKEEEVEESRSRMSLRSMVVCQKGQRSILIVICNTLQNTAATVQTPDC